MKDNLGSILERLSEKEFDLESDAKVWIILNQLARRNLSSYERVRLVLLLKPAIEKKAKEKQREHGGTAPGKSLSQKSDEVSTKNELAKLAYVPFDLKPPQCRQVGRRIVSHGLERKRNFSPTIRGEEVMASAGPSDSSSISLGRSLPSPEQMVHREEIEEMRKKFLEGIDKSKLPTKDERYDQEFKKAPRPGASQ